MRVCGEGSISASRLHFFPLTADALYLDPKIYSSEDSKIYQTRTEQIENRWKEVQAER